ncbi:hypothetical protein GOBAR_AA35755 [Gossypium barbadense]|uniref:Uncharacterized protein n=1 Tax=Gossypium barbadense TaxID=3634 RepID=A0A2P5W1I3_GOSBA|nr:hypothetical protein GOBAR_AA35755 [Gossypium barbadense]
MPPKAAKSLETTNSPSTFFFKPKLSKDGLHKGSWVTAYWTVIKNTCPMPYFRLRTAKEILKLKADSSDVFVGFHQLLSKALLGIEMVCKDIASSDLGS